MASRSNYLETAWLKHLVGEETFTPPTIFAALMTTASGESGGGVEATGAGYERKAVTFSAVNGNTVENGAHINFDDLDAVTIVGVSLYDAATGGNLLYFVGGMNVTIAAGQGAVIPAGALDIVAD